MASPAVLDLGRIYHVKDEVQSLEKTFKRVQAVLRDMEQREINDKSLKLWVQELKDVAYDAEDLLDEFEYEDLCRKGEEQVGVTNRVTVCLQPLTENQVHLRRSLLHRIDEIRKRLDDIAKHKNFLRLEELAGLPRPHERKKRGPSSSLLKKVFGLENEKREIIKFLAPSSRDKIGTSSSSTNLRRAHVSVLAIVGMGGIGKTTLAQFAYNDDSVQKDFAQRMWVWVSDDLGMGKLSKQMLEHFGDNQANLNTENINVLQERLRDRLKGARFLLVLDDVWVESYTEWSDVRALLINGGEDSKVIITTRNIRIPAIVGATKTIKLDGLGFEDSWSIFKNCAFEDGKSEQYPRLEAIGRGIVKKLKGMPLAATTIGGLLCGELEESKWSKIQEKELHELEQDEDGIFPALRLSYDHLPPHLKQCFAYFSLFPKDYIFNKDELVQIWMAQGFVQCSQGRERMEDVGSEYFDDLLSRCLIQSVDGDFVIHNLLHKLAQLVSQPSHSYIRIRELQRVKEHACHLRHLTLSIPKEQPDQRNFENLYNFDRLRTIIFLFTHNNYNTEFRVPPDLFLNVTCLRVLDISVGSVEILPSSVGKLKHLRYLDLRKNPIKEIPSSLCSIYRLQTLKLDGCDQLTGLPTGISNLTNLRHLEAETDVISGIVGIGKLTSLQKIEVFSLSDGNGVKLSDLKDLNELGGRLCIKNLERVTCKEEATQARLNDKQYLRILEIEWGDASGRNNILDEEVLESLLPPPNLQQLEIKCYGGFRYPVWMEEQSISQLKSICLHKCKRWNALPSLHHLSSLRVVSIAHCPQLKDLPLLPTRLQKLTLLDVGLGALSGLQELQLQELEISNNLELREVSHLPITLKELTIKNIPLIVSLPRFWRCQEVTKGETCNNVPSLSTLKVQSCPRLLSLREGLLQHHLQALRTLCIIDCVELVQWPEGEGFRATLLALEEELRVENCPKLMAFPEGYVLSTSLKNLTIKGCPSVADRFLFIQLHNLTSEGVHVEKECQSLTSLCDEALQHMRKLDLLNIRYVEHGGDACLPSVQRQKLVLNELLSRTNIDGDGALKLCSLPTPTQAEEFPVAASLVYDRRWLTSALLHDDVLARQIKIEIRCNAWNMTSIEGSLFRCLQSCHPGAASLRWLIIEGYPHEEFAHSLGAEGPSSFQLDSVIVLVIQNCRMRKFLKGTVLRHLSSVRELGILRCPEMTLSSLEEGICSLPFLRRLVVRECPNMFNGGGSVPTRTVSASSSPYASSSSSPPPVLLESLAIDDFSLISDPHFVRDHLTSLQELHLWNSQLTSLTTAAGSAAQGLSTVARKVKLLEFWDCSNLKRLPPDLGSLFPSLRHLQVENCTEIRGIPKTGLPVSLERLEITDCPALAGRCRPPRGEEDDSEEEDTTTSSDVCSDWRLVARIPNIAIDGRIVQGNPLRH